MRDMPPPADPGPGPGPGVTSATPALPAPLLDRLLGQLGALVPVSPSPEYVVTLIPPNTANEASLLRSLRFRLLASDFTQSLRAHPHTTFPVDIHTSPRYSAPAPGVILAGPIAVQVVEIVDVGSTVAAQAARLEPEVYPAGSAGRGRDVIRTVPGAEEAGPGPGPSPARTVTATTSTRSIGPHKLLLEDAAGRRAWAFELERVPGVEIGGRMKLGAKLILVSVPIMRDLLMLQPSNTTVLGGGIEAWEKAGVEKRKEFVKVTTALDGRT